MTIGVFFGSRSPEHDVSIITAELIIAGLKKLDHEAIGIYISKSGDWFIDPRLNELAFFQAPDFENKLESLKPVSLNFRKSNKKSKIAFKTAGFGGKSFEIDLAFPAFHGERGEDGAASGFFEFFDVPYVGCDIAASAIAMDKIFLKQVVSAAGIETAPYLGFEASRWKAERENILTAGENLGFPVFVKPARLGSSIGIEKQRIEKN